MLSTVLWSAFVAIALVANVVCVVGGVLGTVMIAQFLEHGVLSAVQRHKLQKSKSQSELRILFYRVYWSMTLVYLAATAAWVYLSDRTTSKLVYGVTFLFWMQLFQLIVAVMLSSWEDVLKKAKTAGRRKWVRTLQARLFPTAA
ncbi:hypothetical protein FI667_g9565, partial [Globisporangium splendens]